MKKLFYLLLATVGILAVGCTAEEAPRVETGLVFREVPVNIGQDGEEDTKSLVSVDVEGFKKAALFAFNASTKKVITRNGAPISITTESKIFSWSLPVNVAMDVYVLVNYGDMDISSYLTNASLTESQLEALKFTCNGSDELRKLETKGYGLPMASVKRGVTITSSNSTLAFKVKRLFSKYDFYFDASEFTSAGYTVNALYISSSKANTEVPFFVEGFKQTDQSKLKIVDLGTPEDISNLNYGDKAHAISLYFLENCQGNKSGAANWWDVAGSGIDGLNLCTYIDVGVKTTDPIGNDKNFFYWIYLGDDCKSNFDVNRNQYRTIKLKLRKPVPGEPIPTKGIAFNDTVNKYDVTSSSSNIYRLFFETNIPSSEISFTFTPSDGVSGKYQTVDPQVENFGLKSNAGTSVKDKFETGYPYCGYLVFKLDADKKTKVTIGQKNGSTWSASDERTVSVTKSTTTYRLTRLTLVTNSIEVNGTTTGKVYEQKYVNGVASGSEYVDEAMSWIWSSSNSNVASVSSSGVITGKAAGTATITAYTTSSFYESGYRSVSATITVKAGSSPTPVGTEYQNVSVIISASPATIAASGSTSALTSTLTASVSYQSRTKYSDGTYSSWTTVNDATPTLNGPASGSWITALSNVAAKTRQVTAQENTGTSERKATYTASFSIGGISKSASCEITQTGKNAPTPTGTEYQNVSVTLTATPNSFTAAGGSSTLSASGTWQERTKYSDGTYSSWTSKSTTNFSDFTISGSATGFTRSGANVSVAANTGAARSVTYTAKLTKGSVSGQGQATITQAAPPSNDDNFEWIDTEISVNPGGTATAQFYSSTNSASISSYTTSVFSDVTIDPTSYISTGNSGSRKYKGKATITAKSTAGGASGTVTGAVGSSNDQLKVTVPLKVVSMIISGISEYSTQMNATFKATVTLNNGTVHTSDSHPSYFEWNNQGNDFEQYDYYGTFKLPGQGKSGYIWCSYDNGTVSKEVSHYVKFVETVVNYTFVAARLVLDRAENGYDYYHVDIKCKNQDNVERIFQVEGNSFEVNGVNVGLSWDCVEGGLWTGCTNVVPTGTTIRVGLKVNGVNRGYVGSGW